MATLELPITPNIPATQFKIELDGRNFEFIFTFNTRAQNWTFNILDDAGDVLLAGIDILVKQLLINKYQHDTRLPQGNLFAINVVDEDAKATDANLGSDVVLLYEEAS